MPPAEKTTRQMIEGIPVPPVVGLLVNYFHQNIRARLNPKADVIALFINFVGSPLGICMYSLIIYCRKQSIQ